MEVTNPYKFIGFGAMEVTKPYKFIGFGTTYPDSCVCCVLLSLPKFQEMAL